jgi:hypothetical protein
LRTRSRPCSRSHVRVSASMSLTGLCARPAFTAASPLRAQNPCQSGSASQSGATRGP